MMKFAPLLLAALLALTPASTFADIRTDLKTVVAKVQAKVDAGQRTEEALADEVKALEAILAAHKDEKTDIVAEVAYWKALLYIQVIAGQEAKGIAELRKIVADFPETSIGKQVPRMITELEGLAARAEAQKRVIGAPLKDFLEKDLEGQPLSIASRKGKVVLIDFWATICPPCVHEMPNLIKVYEKYHEKGFEIIGISLDRDKDSLTTFLKEKKMTWPQYFDGKSFDGKLATLYGIDRMPTTFLLDREGKLIEADLRGEELEAAVEKAVATAK